MITVKKLMPLFAVLLAFLTLASCSEKKESVNISFKGDSASGESFVIALLPKQNVFQQKKQYKALAEYLSKTTGMNVRTKLLDSYDAIYDEMLNNKVDAAFLGSLSYVVMNSKIPLDPIARPYRKDGTSTYRGLIFALRNKGITEDIRTWEGKRIALVHKSTTAGYVFPRYHLSKKGVTGFEGYFSKVIYTGSHDASALAVFQNEVDIGCAADDIFNELIGKNPLMREKLAVVASSPQVPSNTLAMRESADAKLKEKLKEALLNMDKTPQGRDALSMLGAVRFIETKESEFGPIFEMLNALGLKAGDFALEAIGMTNIKSESSER